MKLISRNLLWTTLLSYAVTVSLPHQQAVFADTNKPSAQSSIPYVATRFDAVRDLLWMAEVGTNDVVYDLGSGDGRIVIAAVRDFHARKAVGIEINPDLVRESRENAAKAGVTNGVQFIQGDLFTSDFSEASVAVLYLGHGANQDLRARLLRTLKPGSRIVSHQFGMGEWQPDKLLDVRTPILGMYGEQFNEFRTNPDVPDYRSVPGPPMHDALAEWIVPARVAGVCHGNQLANAPGELTLNLHQRLSGLSGSFQFKGRTNWSGFVLTDMWGDHLRFTCIPTNGAYGTFLARFDGHASGSNLNGQLEISQNPRPADSSSERKVETFTWSARRDPADFAGTWEWTGAKDSPVQLKIERRDGRWAATYTDPNRKVPVWAGSNQPVPVTDFYDFGGGFYFTVLLGSLPDGSRMMGPEDGWLIGEAIAQENDLVGNIAFFPHREMGSISTVRTTAAGSSAEARPVIREGWTNWRPKRVNP